MSEQARITRLGHQGDGIAGTAGGPVFVPFTLPGEIASISGEGPKRNLERIIEASPDRAEPFCSHFGICGGCQLQHVRSETYLDWKRSLLVSALEKAGVTADIRPLASHSRSSRRRAILSAMATEKGLVMGFTRRESNRIVDLDACPVLVPALNAAMPAVRELAGLSATRKGVMKIGLLACDNGIDLALNNGQAASDRVIRAITLHPAAQAFARISLNGETILERMRPMLGAGLALVTPPPASFAQASAGAEAEMAALVTGHLGAARRVIDLFSGFGTFALRLAETAPVHAVDSEKAALAALDRAWRETGGKLKMVTHERRDLFRSPVTAGELKGYDGAVFDPPRAGAEAQAGELAKSGIRRIAAVSCNPATLARDLSILIAGGYRIRSVTPIDQFAYTPHLEAVALLER